VTAREMEIKENHYIRIIIIMQPCTRDPQHNCLKCKRSPQIKNDSSKQQDIRKSALVSCMSYLIPEKVTTPYSRQDELNEITHSRGSQSAIRRVRPFADRFRYFRNSRITNFIRSAKIFVM
jgi:hypothetical protein